MSSSEENMHNPSGHDVSVIWRGKKYIIKMNTASTLRDLAQELQKLTNVKAETMRLIVPQISGKSSKMLSPFSDEHGCLNLQETSIFEGKAIRMMGVSKDEFDEVLQSAKKNLRIAGFEEEESRLRQRLSNKLQASVKLPQGPYVFCEFRTLQIPGVELNPPTSDALKRMHMLAADPGIVAIMNKHHWRVGIMTEMAPIGYVGVSPKCLLGFNKNHGEEISLRLRTDDLRGFRKYESIRKTLLHELAHMIFSEHDANFYALDKQLNEEAASLDWTRSRGHNLAGVRYSQHDDEEDYNGMDRSSISQKLGGNIVDSLSTARASSVAAAYRRSAQASAFSSEVSKMHEEPDPDDTWSMINIEFDPSMGKEDLVLENPADLVLENPAKALINHHQEPDPDDLSDYQNKFEPDPDDSLGCDKEGKLVASLSLWKMESRMSDGEPDPDDLESSTACKVAAEPGNNLSRRIEILDSRIQQTQIVDEPDADDLETRSILVYGKGARFDEEDSPVPEVIKNQTHPIMVVNEPDPDDLQNGAMKVEPDRGEKLGLSEIQIDEPDPDDQEIQRIQDSITLVCKRLRNAIHMLQAEVNAMEASTVLQTLSKIIRNVIENPNDMKYRRLRKANPIIQRNVANHKAAMEILFLIGFIEDVVMDEIGKAETFLVLKRNDPGLLWLAKSSLETCIAY